MERMSAMLWPHAQSRASTNSRVKVASHSASGAVMVTSQTWSLTQLAFLALEPADDRLGGLGVPSHGAPACDDLAVVADAYPPAGHLLAVGMQDEVHRALRTHRSIQGGVPAHEDLVVPQAQLTAPVVTAVLDINASGEGFQVDQLALLVEPNLLERDQFLAVLGRLP